MNRTRLLLPAVALLLFGSPAASEESFGSAEARALIPAASAMTRERAKVILNLGASLRWEDMQDGKSTPLSVVLLALCAPPYGDPASDGACAECIRSPGMGWGVTPADMLGPEAWAGAAESGSLLRGEFITDVTCDRTGDRAHGRVSFSRKGSPAPGLPAVVIYEGSVEWGAHREASGWRIDEFRLPACDVRVFLSEGIWRAELLSRPGALFVPVRREERDVPLAALPRVQGGLPLDVRGRVYGVGVRPDGRIWACAHMPNLEALTLALRFLALGLPPSDRVLLRLHADAPWSVTWQLFGACATARLGSPRATIAVRDEVGSGTETLGLPMPDVPTGPFRAGPAIRVHVAPHAKAPGIGKVLAALATRVAGQASATVELDASPGVATGHVVRVLAAVRSAGAKKTVLLLPPEPPDAKASPQDIAKASPVTAPGFTVTVDGETVAGE